MAYNKDNYENNRLTPKQEAFIDGILQGLTQRQAYLKAYPNSKNWKENSVDCAASYLMDNTKIIHRLKELGWHDKTEVLITRKKMLKRLDTVMQKHEEEMDRIQKAYEKDKLKVMAELQQWMKLLDVPNIDREGVQNKINYLTQRLIDMDKIRTLNSTNTTGILKAADRINRMMGYDITKVEIQSVDEEREEMEKLSNEKLEVLANAILNNRKSDESPTG